MSHHGLAITVVGDVDAGCLTRLRAIQGAEILCITALADAPAACGERHADVILLGIEGNSPHDAAVIAALRHQDAAANRYSCVVQYLAAPSAAALAGVDDVLLPSELDLLPLRIQAFARRAALETAMLQSPQRAPGDVLLQDALTGLGNWRYLTHHLEALLGETSARGGLSCCALLSIDRLDQIGERHGDDVKNEVLRSVAARLRTLLRPTDIIARTSDNEFGIALRYTDSGHPRPWVFERLLRAVNYPALIINGDAMDITVSVGVCCSNGSGESTSFDMLAGAGALMRDARAAGGNILKM